MPQRFVYQATILDGILRVAHLQRSQQQPFDRLCRGRHKVGMFHGIDRPDCDRGGVTLEEAARSLGKADIQPGIAVASGTAWRGTWIRCETAISCRAM